MEEKEFSHLLPVEPLLALQLHPTQKSAMTSASPKLPSRADSFQSSMTEMGYKVYGHDGEGAQRIVAAAWQSWRSTCQRHPPQPCGMSCAS
jgi:hypothetical protein